MTTTHLPDPRQYPSATLSNRLIHLTQSVLTAASDEQREQHRADLRHALTDLLERDEVLLLSVALNMAPSRAAYQELWLGLRAAVEQAPERHAVIFAIPLVLVAGSRERATLPERIEDVDGLNALLRAQGVFAADAEVFLSGKLLAPEALLGISPAQLYRYTRQLVDAGRGLPLELSASAVSVKEEGVFLRYLVGVAIEQANAAQPVCFDSKVGAWGVPLMKFLGTQLHVDGVTLFPIARPPAPLMQAIAAGNQARLDVALQVFTSSLLRKLRSEGKQPMAQVASHGSNEIHFTISARGASLQGAECFVWPLSPLDSVRRIEEDFRLLMQECQVEQVVFAADISAA
jgi:hypothetical protein